MIESKKVKAIELFFALFYKRVSLICVDTIRLYKRYLHTPAVKGGIGRLVINLSLGSERTKVVSISFSKMPVGRLKTSQTKIA